MRVSINLVTYNSLRYVDDCLRSIFAQTFQDFKVLVIDNASDDGTVKHIRQQYPTVTVLQNFKNLGFAKAQNQAIKFWDSEYVLVCNLDVVLQPTFLERLISTADALPQYGSFGGKNLRLQSPDADRRPDEIDSAGLIITKAGRIYDRGAGEADKGQYDHPEDVFGLSANTVLYRRAALQAVAAPNADRQRQQPFSDHQPYQEYFDEDFFMYKEDADMAWRLQWAGWPARYIPSAEIAHGRSGFAHATSERKLWQAMQDRWRKAAFINRLSYRNHFQVLFKNLAWSDGLRFFLWIVWYELRKLCWVLIAEPKTFFLALGLWSRLGVLVRKRHYITKHRRVTPESLRHWFR